MNPALFALFLRSLRDDTRSHTMMWGRSIMAVTVLAVVFQFRVSRMFGAAGRDFFESVVYINLLFICVATLSYFAGSVTEEKEEGTLGLLQMTDLDPLAILLGKSTSRLCGGLLVLLVQFPFSLLAVTLGGLRWDQVAGCYAVLGSFLFFGANVGLLGSVLARRTPGAAIITGCLAIPFVFGGNVARHNLDIVFGNRWETIFPLLSAAVETWQRAAITDTLNGVLYDRAGANSIPATVILFLAGGGASFLFAWLLFDRFCTDETAIAGRFRPRTPGRMRLYPSLGHGRAWWGWRMEAVMWKDFQFMHGGWAVVIAKTAGYILLAVWILFTGYSDRGKVAVPWKEFFPTFAGTTFLALFAESLFAASRVFRIEKNHRTLSGLFALPHDLPDLIAAKQKAVVLSLLPVGVFFIVSMTAAMGLNIPDARPSNGEEFFYLVMFCLWTVGQFFLNVRLVAWFSLRLKWGGLPLALAISFVANMVGSGFAFFMFHQGGAVILPLVTWIIAYAMKDVVRRRIELAATED